MKATDACLRPRARASPRRPDRGEAGAAAERGGPAAGGAPPVGARLQGRGARAGRQGAAAPGAGLGGGADALFGNSGSVFLELFEDGLVDENFSAGYTADPSYAFAMVGGETDDTGRLRRALEPALDAAVKEGLFTP